MTNLVVASFANEEQAIKASHKLAELESFGDITVYEKAMVKKELNGSLTPLQEDTTEGLRIVSGMTLGTMIGAFAGPVGMIIGMLSGTVAGSVLEANYEDFSEDFTSKVSGQLQPGMVAIIAEIYEEGPAFVDNALEPLGAAIFRSDVDYVYDDYVDEQVDDIEKEIAAERSKIKSSAAGEKTKIQEKIASLKEKRHQRIVSMKRKQKSAWARFKLKIKEDRESNIRERIYEHQEKIADLKEKLNDLEQE